MNKFNILFVLYYSQQVSFTWRVSSLLTPLNDASFDIADDESSFSFLLKLNSHHPYTFTWSLQQTLKQNHRALHNCYSVKNMLKLLAIKWLSNELFLETEWSEVRLILLLVLIKFIGSFKILSLISLYKWFPL